MYTLTVGSEEEYCPLARRGTSKMSKRKRLWNLPRGMRKQNPRGLRQRTRGKQQRKKNFSMGVFFRREGLIGTCRRRKHRTKHKSSRRTDLPAHRAISPGGHVSVPLQGAGLQKRNWLNLNFELV